MTDPTALISRLTARNQKPLNVTVNGTLEIEILWQTPLGDGVQIVYRSRIPASPANEPALLAGVYYPESQQMTPYSAEETGRILSLLEQLLPPAETDSGTASAEDTSPFELPPEPAWMDQLSQETPASPSIPPEPEGKPATPNLTVIRPDHSAKKLQPESYEADGSLTAKLLTKARAAELAGRWLEAAEAYEDALVTGRIGGQLVWRLEYTCGQFFRRSGQPERAFFHIFRAAQSGHLEAALVCGSMYEQGEGVEASLEQARNWYQRIATQDCINKAEAAYLLGKTYRKTAPLEAFSWFKQAVKLGHTESQRLLGVMYYTGDTPDGKNLEESFRWFKLAAEQGEANAQAAVGEYYYKGKGTPVNYEKALEWFQKAAAQNHPQAMMYCALIYLLGEGCQPDNAAGLRYLRQAVELDHPQACYFYGMGLCLGKYGLETNKEAGMRWLVKSASANYAEAQFSVGCFAYQDALKANRTNDIGAITWMNRAAENGHPDAPYFCGEIFRQGLGTGKDFVQAINYYQQAIQRKSKYSGNACLQCGSICCNGTPPDYAKAFEFYLQGQRLGNVSCIHMLGLLYHKGLGVEKDSVKAMQFFERAAEKDDPYSLYTLGELHYHGDGIPADQMKAFEYYSKAAKLGYAKAAGICASMCYDGDGVKKDFALALQYAEPAAEDSKNGPGDPVAQCVCGQIYYRGFRGIPKDRQRAVEYYRRAAEQNYDMAQYLYGLQLVGGKYVPMDQEKGLEFIRKAAAQGNKQAERSLKLLGG